MTTEQMDQADDHRKARAVTETTISMSASPANKVLTPDDLLEFLIKAKADGVDLNTVDYSIRLKGGARISAITIKSPRRD